MYMMINNSHLSRSLLSFCQTAEVKKLRAEDPKLWTVIALSRMLEVKPLAILYVPSFVLIEIPGQS